jgi:hypothetical protein
MFMEPFIAPNHNINDVTSQDWKYYSNLSKDALRHRWQTPIGQQLLKSLLDSRFSLTALEKHVGRYSDQFDLRGIPLTNADLSSLNLSGIDFFASDLSGTSFKNSDLTGSYLSECNISGSMFDWAKLDDALLDNVKFNQVTSFLGVKLHTINFTLATLLYDLAISQQRIQQLEQHYPIFACFLRLSCDYGRSFSRYLLWVSAFIFAYAGIYWLLNDTSTPRTFLDYLYFSVVTFTTVGYGDIVPVGLLSKLIVISEIILGYLMGGLLVAILAKRVIG